MGNLHKVKITDLVKDDYESWKQGSMIFIFSGTGSGKTTLALEKITISYIDKGKSVLYLVPRELLRKEINKVMQSIIAKSEYKYYAENYNNNFDIWTYQHFLAPHILHTQRVHSGVSQKHPSIPLPMGSMG